jgi:hypothetical protein
MAEDLQACVPEPFVGTQQFQVPIGTTIVRLNEVKGVAVTMPVCRRPIVPLWGVELNALTGAYDFLPSTKGNEQTLIEIALGCYRASQNFAAGTTGTSNDQYTPNSGQNFGGYLNRKLRADTCLENRFKEVYNKAASFFRLHGAIAAYDIAIYKELHNELIPLVMREADKQMFIPSGNYFFTGGLANPVVASVDAWSTVSPTLTALFALELVTT